MAQKKDGVPAWQQSAAPTPSESDLDQPNETKQAEEQVKSREDLLEQARTFLAHEEIKDATTESKISFLEDKGLTNDEIQQLLGISRNETSTAVITDTPEDEVESTDSNPTSSQPDPPPIITYPEFLLHASKPPPIVTPERALRTVSAVSMIGATIYGASKFIFQPMFETLTEARHELFGVTREHLEPLNKKLEEVVSTIPPQARSSNAGHERRVNDDHQDDASSTASDPTEMFHRDMGVQTSPPLSPSLSASSGTDPDKPTATGQAASRLQDLRQHLDSLLQSSNSALTTSDTTKQAVRDMDIYLDVLRHSQGLGQSGMIGDPIVRSQLFGSNVANMAKNTDAVDSLKAEIRSMKGALLSARNFPRGNK